MERIPDPAPAGAPPEPAPARGGLSVLAANILDLPRAFLRSFVRHGPPTTDRGRSETMFGNLLLHVQSVKTHANTLRPGYTLGLGLISFYLFALTCASGALLMLYYVPSVERAYDSVKDITYVVFAGRILRNFHKWAGEAMIVFVLLHMARVFYTGSYKRGREFNWVVGIALLALTFVLNLTGYLLPWDQLSYWALVIVANITHSPREVTDALGVTRHLDLAGFSKEMLLGGTVPGAASLTRVYLLHVMVLPALTALLIAVHFFRIRKDGGITRPDDFARTPADDSAAPAPVKRGGLFPASKTYGLMELARGRPVAAARDVENTVPSFPNLLIAELAVLAFTLALVMICAVAVDAPLKEPANPLIPENPAKAPWYFLGLQELVAYSAFCGGVLLPTAALALFALIPYLDREERHVGVWFSSPAGRRVALLSFLAGAAGSIGMVAFVVRHGWFRAWWPGVHQLVITAVNPGSLFALFTLGASLAVLRRTGSTRLAAICLFTMCMTAYVVLSYVGSELRGPNWDFYWSKSRWPAH